MAKWRVFGSVSIGVEVTVEADDEQSAIEAALDSWEGLTNFCGNGSTDKLIGTTDQTVSIDAGGDEPIFTDAEAATDG